MTSVDTQIDRLLASREAKAAEIEAAATTLGRAYGDYRAAGDEIVRLASAEQHIDPVHIMDDVHLATSNPEQLIGGILLSEGGLDISGSRNGIQRLTAGSFTDAAADAARRVRRRIEISRTNVARERRDGSFEAVS